MSARLRTALSPPPAAVGAVCAPSAIVVPYWK